MDISEIKKLTLELIGSTNDEDVAYITEEYVNSDGSEVDLDSSDEALKFPRPYFGHSVRYGYRNGSYTYEFLSNSTWSGNVCAGRTHYWFYQSRVNHYSTGQNCRVNNNNTAVIRFEPR